MKVRALIANNQCRSPGNSNGFTNILLHSMHSPLPVFLACLVSFKVSFSDNDIWSFSKPRRLISDHKMEIKKSQPSKMGKGVGEFVFIDQSENDFF